MFHTSSLGRPSQWAGPPLLTRERADHLRDALLSHGDDTTTGACGRCGVTRCETWRSAYDQLAFVGELMVDPARWNGGQ